MRSLSTRFTSAVAGLAVAAGLALAGTGTAAAAAPVATAPALFGSGDHAGPPQRAFASAYGYSVLAPTAVPSGADDRSCRPTAAHPRPVVLVHGTFENRYADWAGLAPELKRQGHCVYALDYGGAVGPVTGLGDIRDSAREPAAFVERVRAATGAAKVDLVGHSQGGMTPRHHLKNLGGTTKVDKLVALSPTNHGTGLLGLGTMARVVPLGDEFLGLLCTACSRQITGSGFVTALNSPGETHPGVTYTVIATRYEEVVTPYTSSFLAAAPNVTDQRVQDFRPDDSTEHLGISYDPVATRLVLDALDPAHARRPAC